VSNPAALKDALTLMQQHPDIWSGSLARKGGMLSHSAGEELGSTMSTVGRFISFMNTPSVAESLRSSSFDLSRLRRGRMTIYMIQRAADTRTGSPLLRLWLNACIREVMKGGLS
jgi:type IV secretory pathway TraG/TraD family ATPase VirD4